MILLLRKYNKNSCGIFKSLLFFYIGSLCLTPCLVNAQTPPKKPTQEIRKNTNSIKKVKPQIAAATASSVIPSPATATATAIVGPSSFSPENASDSAILQRIHIDLWACLLNARVFYKLKKEDSQGALDILKNYQVVNIIGSPEFYKVRNEIGSAQQLDSIVLAYTQINFMLAELYGYFGDISKAEMFLSEIERLLPAKLLSASITSNQENVTISDALEKMRTNLIIITK